MQALYFLAAAWPEFQVFFWKIQLHPWKVIGLLGMLTFSMRFIIQWIASERAGRSVIPFGFWECSAAGSFLMLSYFAIYQHDSVGVLQNIFPLPIYLRNLYLRYRNREPRHPGNVPRSEE